MWIALVAIFVVIVVLMVLNARARARLEQLGGDKSDPTRRHWWMRFGG